MSYRISSLARPAGCALSGSSDRKRVDRTRRATSVMAELTPWAGRDASNSSLNSCEL